MYGSDAGKPVPSLYTKGLSPLCDYRCIPNDYNILDKSNSSALPMNVITCIGMVRVGLIYRRIVVIG